MVVLAAGGSTRMGRPKQLLPWQDTTLLGHATRTALDAAVGPVLVMLGARADECLTTLRGLNVETHVHADWEQGMGSTITAATLEVMRRYPSAGALMLTTCDQPHVRAADLVAIDRTWRENDSAIVAATYADIVGIPVLFRRASYPMLTSLPYESGAGFLLKRLARKGDIDTVPVAGAAWDIDTPQDFEGRPTN